MGGCLAWAFSLFLSPSIQADRLPSEYQGLWSISVLSEKGFPWWQQIKYPVQLEIKTDGISLIDQSGYKCNVRTIAYDELNEGIEFVHCGSGNKNERAKKIVQRVYLSHNGYLIGQVYRQNENKPIFLWKGKKETE